MKKQPHIAKITRPRAIGIFPRKRLFRLLDTFRKYPVIWISGPAGSGKTTLVSSYLDANKLPCLWYQVDEGDSDIATFFSYMGMAAKKAAPRRRTSLPLLTPEYLQGISTFTLRYFENLFGRLKVPSALVLDNYHSVPAESNFHDVICNGLSTIPEGTNVILISRHDLPPALSRLRANGLIKALGWDELRLSLEESGGIVRLREEGKTSKETIKRLHDATNGWVAGLVLMLESLKRGIEPHLLGKLTPTEIIDYFGNELFSKAEEEMQEFLLKTSFLPRMTTKMAEEITGFPKADEILSTLSRDNNFTEAHYSQETMYQYHPLFREFLMARARETFSTETLSTLLHREALLLEEAGQTRDAAYLFLELKDWEGLTGLVLKHAPNLVGQGRSRPLEKWLNRFPDEMMEKVPWLLYWKGVCRLFYSPADARVEFERAFHLFEAQGDDAGTCLAWSGVVDSIYFEWDDFARLDRWIDWLDKRMQQNPSFPSPEIEARVSSSMTGALLWRQPQRPDFEEWLNRALQASEEIGNINLRLQNSGSAVVYYMWVGKLDKLNMMIEETKKVALSSSATPFHLIFWKLWGAMYLETLVSDPELHIQAILGGLKIGQEHGIHVLDHMLFAHGVYGALSLGDLTKAEEYLHKMEASFGPGQRNMAALYHCLSGWCELLRGRTAQASPHAEKAVELTVETGTPVPELMTRILMAKVLHGKGEEEGASAQLTNVKGLIERYGCQYSEYQLLLAEAQFAMDRGEEEECIKALRKGLAHGKSIGLKTMVFIWQPAVMARLCAIALEKGIEVEYVRELIRIFRLPPDDISSGIESWPWPLKIYTLGKFELLRDDKPLQFSGKVQKKPLEMLKALIAFGGSEVSEGQITDSLWPDADGDAAHSAFTTTLSRLRKLIGNDKAIELHEGKASLDPSYCWVDAWAFERIVQQSEAEFKRMGERETQRDDEEKQMIQLVEKAIAIYKGQFLAADEGYLWTTSFRERLRTKFFRLVTRIGEHLENRDRWEKAIEYYQRALDIDDLGEEFYQHLMICYRHLGQDGKAVETYRCCKKTLTATLGIEPSPKTQAIYRTLTGNVKFKT